MSHSAFATMSPVHSDNQSDHTGASVALHGPIENAQLTPSTQAPVRSLPPPLVPSVRVMISQRSTHARALVESTQAFVVFGGYLRLRESSREWRMKTWYCALLRSQLYFYPTKTDATRAAKLHRSVTLAPNGASVSDGLGKLHTYPHAFTFETMRGDEFFCSAPSADEQQQWVDQINRAAAAASAMGKEDGDASSNGTLNSPPEYDDDDCRSDETSDKFPSTPGTDDNQEQEHAIRAIPSAASLLSSFSTQSSSSSSSSFSVASSSSSSSTTSCFTCGTTFGLLRTHRRTCRSCSRAFCRVHCSKPSVRMAIASRDVDLSAHTAPIAAHSSRGRVCDECSHRQHFIVFVETFTAKAIRLIRHDDVSITQSTTATTTVRQTQQLHELAIVIANPASFTVLNVLCLLKKHVESPWMFTRVLCMLIPLYESDAAALEEYWVQFLAVFVPLLATKDPFSPSMQFFLRMIFAVCRRSNAFALRTVWECLAFYEDAKTKDDTVTMSYLMLLMISCSAFDGNSVYVLKKLLGHAPQAQVDAIASAMKDFLGVRSVLREEIPNSLAAKWFNAMCLHDVTTASEIVRAASDSIHDADVLLQLFDPCETGYIDLLTANGVVVAEEPPPCTRRHEDDAFMTRKEREFDAQAAFVEQLTSISDLLRHVQVVERRLETLRQLLVALQQQHLQPTLDDSKTEASVRLHAPLADANAEPLRLLRVVPSEGRVFSTRARAPTLMVFEACPLSRKRVAAKSMVEADEESEKDAADDALAPPTRQRTRSQAAPIGRRDSAMLDAMLCGLKEDDVASTDSSEDASATSSGDDLQPPHELLVADARDTYEDSIAVSYLAAFRGNDTSSGRVKWQRSLRSGSPYGHVRGWALVSLIAKSHDDLRQEVFAIQLMRNLQLILEANELSRIYLRPYEIRCTGANVGLIETLTDAQSVDAIKKEYGSLLEYFVAQFGSPSDSRFQAAQDAFVCSMAGASLYCYLFQIKDRHNGNIMLSDRGHVMHIDFGFMMGSAPGGAFSLEDAPFKLTKEMVELMGGATSRGYSDFVQLFTDGFLAVRRDYIKLITLIHLTTQDSPFPCFQYQTPRIVLRNFRERLFLNEHDDGVVRHRIRKLVDKSYNHWGTRQFDRFQHSSNGIMP